MWSKNEYIIIIISDALTRSTNMDANTLWRHVL